MSDTQANAISDYPILDDVYLSDTELHSFETCYNNYFVRLVSGLRRLHGHDGFDAEDIAHRAFEKFALRLRETEIHNPEAFVWRVAQNLVLNHRRRERVRERHVEETAHTETLANENDLSPERILINNHELARVNAAIAALGERRRQIFLLRRVDGLNYTQIAEVMGISRNAVKKNLEKAVAEIDRFLAEN